MLTYNQAAQTPADTGGTESHYMTSDCRSYSPLCQNTIPPTNIGKDSKDLKQHGICTRDISYSYVFKFGTTAFQHVSLGKDLQNLLLGLISLATTLVLKMYASFLQSNLQRDTVFRYPTQEDKT